MICSEFVDFVDFVAESVSLFEKRDVGKFDLIINKHNTNDYFKDKTFIEVIDADKLYNASRVKNAEELWKTGTG